jgi:hypothetical protein
MDDVRELPFASEGAIKIDQIYRNLGVAVGKVIFALQQLDLRRDDIQDRASAGRPTALRCAVVADVRGVQPPLRIPPHR